MLNELFGRFDQLAKVGTHYCGPVMMMVMTHTMKMMRVMIVIIRSGGVSK